MTLLIILLFFVVFLLLSILVILFRRLNRLEKENQTLHYKLTRRTIDKNELVKKQMDLSMLQEQINPHFLYNTLEAIRSQAVLADQDAIASATETLGNYFRYCINSHGQPVHLFEELQNIQDYYQIIRFRFLDRITLVINISDPSILQSYLPRLTIQPVVENAINHGLKNIISNATVTISAAKTENIITLKISDNGCGMSETQLKELEDRITRPLELMMAKGEKHGIALPNIHHRIQLMFGSSYGLHIQSMTNEGTDVLIDYPIDYERVIKDQNERIHPAD